VADNLHAFRLKELRIEVKKALQAPKLSFICADFWNVISIMFGKQCCGRFLMLAGVAASIVVWLTTSASAQFTQTAYREDRILIKPKAEINWTALDNFHLARKGEVLRTFDGIGHLQVLRVPEGETVPGLIAQYQKSGLVEFAEPDYIGQVFDTKPNETAFTNGTLWGTQRHQRPASVGRADLRQQHRGGRAGHGSPLHPRRPGIEHVGEPQ
jgi:hypothetical protein